MPTFREITLYVNFSRQLFEITSPAKFSCQLFESYCVCQLLIPIFRELLHLLPTFREAFTCQLLTPNFSKGTSPANIAGQFFENYFTCQLPVPTFRDYFACHPQAYHRIHAELGHVLLALGPGLVHPLQRAPQRRRADVAPRGIAASETLGDQSGPTYGNKLRQDCLASQQPSTKPRSGSTASTGSTPLAGHRVGRGKGALSSPLRLQRTTSTSHANFSLELLHLSTFRTNFSRVTSPASLLYHLFESYFTCQLLVPTFRGITSPTNFSC